LKVEAKGGILVAPLQILLNVFIWIPFFLVIALSLFSWSATMGPNWWEAPFVGIRNYVDILQDEGFLMALGRTLIVVAVAVCLEFGLGLFLTLLIASLPRGRRIVTPIFLMPMMFLPIVTGYDFFMIFYGHGPLNAILSMLLGHEVMVEWLANSTSALFAIILADVWQWTPFMFLILYSAYMAAPEEPVKVARTLGASEAYIFRRITLPALRDVIMIALIIRSLECFKIFDIPWIMTAGGPGAATQTISIYMYLEGFKYWNLSYISAGALILLGMIIIVTRYATNRLLIVEKKM
jgi:multiple sugar transport system permease protein